MRRTWIRLLAALTLCVGAFALCIALGRGGLTLYFEIPPEATGVSFRFEPEGIARVTDSRVSADGSEYAEGDTVTYECTIMNTGDVTISELTAFDTLGISSPSLGTLYPGESTSYVFNYTVTGSDVSAGSVYCSVSARGMVPGGATYSDSSRLFHLDELTPKEVTVTVWMEGEDPQCDNDVQGAQLTLQLSFVACDENGTPIA